MKVSVTSGTITHSVETEEHTFETTERSTITEVANFIDAILRRMYPYAMEGRQIRYSRSHDTEADLNVAPAFAATNSYYRPAQYAPPKYGNLFKCATRNI